jgi:hypothetical protein
MLYPSTALVLGRMSEACKWRSDREVRLLLGVVQIVLALVVIPPLLLVLALIGVGVAAEWGYGRLTAAIDRLGRRAMR